MAASLATRAKLRASFQPRSSRGPAAAQPGTQPRGCLVGRGPRPLVDQAEDLGEYRVPPPFFLAEGQDIGHGAAAAVATRAGSCPSLKVLDRAQDEVRLPKDRGDVIT